MAIRSLEQRKRQQILLIVGLAILLVAGIILYFGFWKGGGIVTEEILLESEPGAPVYEERAILVSEGKLEKIDLDLDFLNQTILPFLKIHGDLPVKKGETGRDNPFIRY